VAAQLASIGGLWQNVQMGINHVHHVLYSGKHGSQKQVRIFYLEDHLFDYVANTWTDIAESDLDCLQDSGKLYLDRNDVQTLEVVSCNCMCPELHFPSMFSQNS
jgi:hypothetical protein